MVEECWGRRRQFERIIILYGKNIKIYYRWIKHIQKHENNISC